MIFFTDNQGPQVRDPTVATYRNKPVIHHKAVVEAIQAAFWLIHGAQIRLQAHTTPDGLDAVIWGKPGKVQTNAVSPLWIGVVLSNSRRQRSALYGGIAKDDWCVVFDRYVFKGKAKLKPDNVDRVMEDCVARWSLFTDRYYVRTDELRTMPLHTTKYNWLLLEAARRRLLAWSRLGRFDKTRPSYEDTALDYLKRFSRAVSLQPPISHEPPRNQLMSNHEMYRALYEI